MKARAFDPLRLDVEGFARQSGHLDGVWPLASLARLTALLAGPPAPRHEVAWQADGESRERTGTQSELWLRLRAVVALTLACQRCLGPAEVPLVVDRRIRFVQDEATAAALDAELEDDVLVLTRSLDLRALVEDELLLALPLVPRHERCRAGVPMPARSGEIVPDDSPFAALAALKKGGAGS